jgi:hypothetical protein
MTAMPNDLTPSDGLSNIWLEFAGFDHHQDSANADVRFRFVHKKDGTSTTLSELSLPVRAERDGFYGMVACAHDDLIAVLRQALYVSDKLRTHYRNEAERTRPY